jgi:hypothetical protein
VGNPQEIGSPPKKGFWALYVRMLLAIAAIVLYSNANGCLEYQNVPRLLGLNTLLMLVAT